MRVVKCSTSSINLYNNCPFSYHLHYILGMESKSGKAALQGKIVHKTFEWMLALKKKNKTNVDPMWLLDRAWDEMIRQDPHIEIRRVTTRIDKNTGNLKAAADYKKCRINIESILSDQYYNPYNMNVIDSEKWFAVDMPGKEWECINENNEKHQFAVRGYIDAVNEIDKDTIEIIDWKTGKRNNFYDQKPIDENILIRSIQPRIYHLAAYFLYPKYKNILITFYYMSDGGPVTIALSSEDVAMTIASLYRVFTRIRNDALIQRNRSWKCKMCSFERTGMCNRVWSDLHTMGTEYIEEKYTKLNYKEQLAIGKQNAV